MSKLNWSSLSFKRDKDKYNLYGVKTVKFESSDQQISFTGESFSDPVYFVESIKKYENYDIRADEPFLWTFGNPSLI